MGWIKSIIEDLGQQNEIWCKSQYSCSVAITKDHLIQVYQSGDPPKEIHLTPEQLPQVIEWLQQAAELTKQYTDGLPPNRPQSQQQTTELGESDGESS